MLCHLSDTFIILDAIPIACCLVVKAICQINLGKTGGKWKKKSPHLLLTPGESVEGYNFVIFQIKSYSRLAASEIIQYKMEELHPSMTV